LYSSCCQRLYLPQCPAGQVNLCCRCLCCLLCILSPAGQLLHQLLLLLLLQLPKHQHELLLEGPHLTGSTIRLCKLAVLLLQLADSCFECSILVLERAN
jgi:hypothetical protein